MVNLASVLMKQLIWSRGYKSIAELEAWEDQIATNKAVLRFQKTLDGF